MSAALTPTRETYQAPGVGPVRTLAVDANWTSVLGEETWDLVAVRVPPGSKRLVVMQSVDDIAGSAATGQQEAASWTLDPGVHILAVNRSEGDGGYFVAVDPTDTGTGTSPVPAKIMRAG